MDMIFVDLTDIENVEVNDEVVIVGSQKSIENGIAEKITLRQVAKWAGTIQDDVLTKFSRIKKTVDWFYLNLLLFFSFWIFKNYRL